MTIQPFRRWVTWRRRAQRLPRSLLLLGLVLVLLPLWLTLPTSHPLELTVVEPATLTRLELAWLEEGDGAPLRRTTYHFQRGSAPPRIVTELRATRGRYLLQTLTERGAERRHQDHRIEVGLLSSELRVVVR
ncbi:MAG: hypothetical protein JRI23_07930 [Deltaproteobacteria bacterium]|jgi:hypothetical protein|nr:hypothetical protein [Deltaproteobacteria bacterium]MBW2531535.1 hypothetical protein [Deltaproteobacteria bacterium]